MSCETGYKYNDIPLHLDYVNGIKGLSNIHLHLSLVICQGLCAIPVFCCTPALLNEIELTMKLGVKECNVPLRLHKLNKGWLLCNKIQLVEKNTTAAASCVWICALETRAFGTLVCFFGEAPLQESRHCLRPDKETCCTTCQLLYSWLIMWK